MTNPRSLAPVAWRRALTVADRIHPRDSDLTELNLPIQFGMTTPATLASLGQEK